MLSANLMAHACDSMGLTEPRGVSAIGPRAGGHGDPIAPEYDIYHCAYFVSKNGFDWETYFAIFCYDLIFGDYTAFSEKEANSLDTLKTRCGCSSMGATRHGDAVLQEEC